MKLNKILLGLITGFMAIAIISLIVLTIIDSNTKTLTDSELEESGNLKRLKIDGHDYLLIRQAKGIAVVHNEACTCKSN